MGNNKITTITILPSWIFIYLVYAALAWFVYGQSTDAVIGVTVLAVILGLFIAIVSFIPTVGWIAAVAISYYWLIPELLILTGLEYTWLITVIFVISSIGGLIITLFMTIALIVLIFGIFN